MTNSRNTEETKILATECAPVRYTDDSGAKTEWQAMVTITAQRNGCRNVLLTVYGAVDARASFDAATELYDTIQNGNVVLVRQEPYVVEDIEFDTQKTKINGSARYTYRVK